MKKSYILSIIASMLLAVSYVSAQTVTVYEAEGGTNGNGVAFKTETNAQGATGQVAYNFAISGQNKITAASGGASGGSGTILVRYSNANVTSKTLKFNTYDSGGTAYAQADVIFPPTGGITIFAYVAVPYSMTFVPNTNGSLNYFKLQNSTGVAISNLEIDNYTVSIPSTYAAVTGVTVSPSSTTVNASSTASLTATFTPSNATNQSVIWTTSNASVATVSTAGVVTAVATGTADITATTGEGGFTSKCTVTVPSSAVAVTGVTVSPSSASVNVGSTTNLSATVAPSDATNKNVIWTSSAPGVATVSGGVVTGVSAGSATITATTADGGKTSTSSITVNAVSVTGVTVSPSSANVGTGATTTLTATIAPANATNKTVNWTSSNTGVATVSGGVVTGVTAGTATITATSQDGSFTSTSLITVTTVYATGVTVTPNPATVVAGAYIPLTANFTPSNTTNKTVFWSTSNSSVARVSVSGIVTGMAAGTATITATTQDGSYTSTSSITVSAAAANYVLNPGFELNTAPSATATNWYEWGSTPANGNVVTGNNLLGDAIGGTPHSGTNYLEFAGSGTYEVNYKQDLSGLPNGTYTLKFWCRGNNASGGYYNIGGSYPGWGSLTSQWTQSTINNVSVTNGGATININYQTTTGGSLDIDDVELTLNQFVLVTGINAVSPASKTLSLNETTTLAATTIPSNASNSVINWSSSNTNVATVSATTGVVTAISAGTATITATTSEGGYTSTSTITVANNYVINPGYEADGAPILLAHGWTKYSGTPAYTDNSNVIAGNVGLGDVVGGAPHSGTYYIEVGPSVANSTTYGVANFQSIANIPNGTYSLTAWFRGNGGGGYLGIGGQYNNFNFANLSQWTQLSINNVVISNGTCQIYIDYSTTQGYKLDIDDIQLKLMTGQTITSLASTATKTVGDANYSPGATASSGLTVSYSSSNTSVATIVSGQVHIVGAGTSTITASQAGDATYTPATNATQTLTVNKASSSISVTGTTSFNYNGSAQGPATASVTGSTGTVTYSYVGVSGTSYSASATAPTAVGSYTVTASVAADANYNGASSSATGFTIAAVVPGVPTAATATAGNAQASVAFTAPSNNGGSPIIDYTVTSSPGSHTATGASSPIIVTGLTNGTTYTFTVTARNSVGSSSASEASNSVTPAPATVTVFASANLSSYTPSSATDVIVTSGELTVDENATVKTLTVNKGGKLTLALGKTLTVVGAFTLQSDATGTATFVDNGGTVTAGTTNVEQYLTSGRNWYVSSPVSGAKSDVFSASSGNPLYWYDEAHGTSAPWATITNTTTDLTVMQGYVANLASSGVITFSGTLNTSAKEIVVNRTASQTKAGFNLVGNPYPSYLDWSNVTKTNLLTTLWYRTKTTPALVTGATTYVFDTYNANGSLGTTNGATAVTNMIPPMQAFWVRVDQGQTSGILAVNNTQRAHADNSSNTFKSKAVASQSVLRLEVSNGINSDQALVNFNSNASNGLDTYDSPKITNASASIPEIYTLAAGEQVVINGVKDLSELTLGFTTGEAGNFIIKASQLVNFASGTQIILRDNLLNYEQDLTLAYYSFYSDVTANNETRFTVLFKAPSVATGINQNSNGHVWISHANNQIVVNGATGETSVTVYNEVGQRLISKRLTATTKSLGTFVPGVYMVTVNNAGKTITQKIIFD